MVVFTILSLSYLMVDFLALLFLEVSGALLVNEVKHLCILYDFFRATLESAGWSVVAIVDHLGTIWTTRRTNDRAITIDKI